MISIALYFEKGRNRGLFLLMPFRPLVAYLKFSFCGLSDSGVAKAFLLEFFQRHIPKFDALEFKAIRA